MGSGGSEDRGQEGRHYWHAKTGAKKERQEKGESVVGGCCLGVNFGPVEMRIYLTVETGSNHICRLSGAVVSKEKKKYPVCFRPLSFFFFLLF